MDREWSDEEIATLAKGLRKFARQDLKKPLDILEVMNRLQSGEAKRDLRMIFVEVPDSQLPNSLAEAEPRRRKIKYRHSLLEDLRKGVPEANEIMLEEIGHVLMHPNSRVLNHFTGVDFRAWNIPEVKRKEQEARKFAWHAKAPIEDAYSASSPDELRSRWNMSSDGSREYFGEIRRTRARIERTGRPLPAEIISFHSEARKRKYPVRIPPDEEPEAPRTDPTPSKGSSRPAESEPVESAEQCEARQMGYLPAHCPNPYCGGLRLRRQSGCTICEGCGYSDGCD
jgi:hypothetical protein